MKINEQPPRTLTDLTVASATTRPKSAVDTAGQGVRSTATPAATVELSSRSRELHATLALAKQSPDVRAGVVADVRAKIDSGTYEIDPTRIARAMLDRRA